MTKTRTSQNAASDNATPRSGKGAERVSQTADVTRKVPAPTTPSPKSPNKQQQLAALIVRDEGATLDQMIVVTSWLPHTTRAALTGLKKKGYVLSSDKIDGMRTYRGIAPQ